MDIERQGEAAKRLLADETFKGTIKELKEELISGWVSTQPDDTKGREELYFLNLALSHIENRLQCKADNVKVMQSKAIKASYKEEQ